MKTPYDSASYDSILSFLVSRGKLHEVLARFIGVDDTMCISRAEEIILDYLNDEGKEYLLRRYLHDHDISHDYNDWYRECRFVP